MNKFILPCGTEYKAKTTKRGYHSFGVVVELMFPGSAAPFWCLNSSHLTRAAAERAMRKALQESPHGVSAHIVRAV